MALTALFFLGLLATFPAGCFSAVNQPFQTQKKSPQDTNRIGSSVILSLQGNVYPLGYYSVNLNIGNPPKLYDLDIDTGSDVTWVQCDTPCTGCTKPRDLLYKPQKNNLVPCADPSCIAMHYPEKPICKNPNDQCDYEVKYADQGSSLGVLVKDNFPIHLYNGSYFNPELAFGCGYNQKYSGPHPPPSTAGVLGLSNGKGSIVSQLHDSGFTQNVIGHCLSGRGGGFLFIGHDLVPSSGVSWTPMSSGYHYSSGPAELLFGGNPTKLENLLIVFDSGSSYTYFNAPTYQKIVDMLREDLTKKPLEVAPEDESLPICWKGRKPFKSVGDVKDYFKPLALKFTNARNVLLQLPPEAYLIVTKEGNVCLGILNGAEVGLKNLNVIGDISMQDKMVIYDTGEQLIGWTAANCDRLPKF